MSLAGSGSLGGKKPSGGSVYARRKTRRSGRRFEGLFCGCEKAQRSGKFLSRWGLFSSAVIGSPVDLHLWLQVGLHFSETGAESLKRTPTYGPEFGLANGNAPLREKQMREA